MIFKCFPVSHFLKEVTYFLTFYYFWSLCTMVLAWPWLILGNQEIFPLNIMNFAYFRSLLHWLQRFFIGHSEMHTQTHIPSHGAFYWILSTRHDGLGTEACVCIGNLCPLSVPLHSRLYLPPNRHLTQWELAKYPGSFCYHCLEEIFISSWYHTSFNSQGYTKQL